MDGKDETAGRVWQLMFDFLIATSTERSLSLARRNLTPNDSRALMSLDAGRGRPIGELARQWGCDPSNATWIVDRLERGGLARREPARHDRRVKLVMLTPHGDETRRTLLAEFRTPPPEIAVLSRSDLRTLETILRKLPSSASGPWAPPGSSTR